MIELLAKVAFTVAAILYTMIVIYGIYLDVFVASKTRKKFVGEIIVDTLFSLVMLSASALALYVAVTLWKSGSHFSPSTFELIVIFSFLIVCIKGFYDLVTFK